MNDTQAPRMIPVVVTVTYADAEKYGPDAYLVTSAADNNGNDPDPRWTIETIPDYARVSEYRRRVAVYSHLVRTHPEHRIAKFGYASELSEELMVEADDFDLRAYRAELRLIAKG